MGKFTHRVGGEDIPRFGGVRQECDPGAIPPNMFRNAVNVRYKGGRLVSRGGQSKFNASALSGRVQGIFSSEFEFSTNVPVGGCPDIGVGGGTEIGSQKLYLLGGDSKYIGYYYFSEDQYPLLRRQPYDITRKVDTALASFGDGVMWVGGFDENLNYLQRFARGGAPTTMATVARVAGTATFCDIERYQGVIYFSVGSNTYSDCRVYRYAGGVIVEDDSPFAAVSERGTPHLRALGADLYMIRGGKFTATTTKIRRKSAGVWATLTPSIANFTCFGQPAVYGDALYAFGEEGEAGAATALKIVGATVTTARALANPSDTFRLPTVFNGYLYYLYEDWNPGTLTLDGLYVGRFDGTTWDDTHKNLFAQFPLLQRPGFWSYLGVFDGKLRAVLLYGDIYGGCPYTVFSSPGLNVAGTWTRHEAGHQKIEDTLGLISSTAGGLYQTGAVM